MSETLRRLRTFAIICAALGSVVLFQAIVSTAYSSSHGTEFADRNGHLLTFLIGGALLAVAAFCIGQYRTVKAKEAETDEPRQRSAADIRSSAD